MQPQARLLAASSDLDVEGIKAVETKRLDGRFLGCVAGGEVLGGVGLVFCISELARMEQLSPQVRVAL